MADPDMRDVFRETFALRLLAQGIEPEYVANAVGGTPAEMQRLARQIEGFPLRAILFAESADLHRHKLRGSYWIAPCGEGEATSLRFICPCGCGNARRIEIGHRHKPALNTPSWHWDGSETSPTLTPSVNCGATGDCTGWHGFLRGGYWELTG